MNKSLQLFLDYQNSIRCTEEGNHPKPHRTSHNFAHSTGLSKPPGYNLEWPRVTPIQVTLITRPLAKHHLMTSFKAVQESSSRSNSSPKTAWCTFHVARRHTLSRAYTRSFHLGGITFSARHHALQASLVFPYHLAAHPKPPGITPQAPRRHTSSVTATSFQDFETSSKESQALYIQFIT